MQNVRRVLPVHVNQLLCLRRSSPLLILAHTTEASRTTQSPFLAVAARLSD